MRTYDVIIKKRNGLELNSEEIAFMINGYTQGEIPDYQMAAWLMAVYFRGMTDREAADLTEAIVQSGERCDLTAIPGIKVDKHSTGGVGDKTTLIVAPLVAAAGVSVAKMSGRGLGHTGGTIDKLESIPGLRTTLTLDSVRDQVAKVGLAVVAQTGNLTPADKKLYALRDVTGTVDSIPLIASSIMSKKLASGADAVVLDVKTGSGAFIKDLKDALGLARTMVAIGEQRGLRTVALVTNMDEPLGYAVGNALEVQEAISVLSGKGPDDLRELCLHLAAQMLVLGQAAPSPQAAMDKLTSILQSGKALAKFSQWISAQGGDARVIGTPEILPRASVTFDVTSALGGYVHSINAEMIGRAASLLGAGRVTKDAPIDLAVGLVARVKVGDAVNKGDPIVTLHANDQGTVDAAAAAVRSAYQITPDSPVKHQLLHAVVSKDGIEMAVE